MHGIIFDCDGTLVDSLGYALQSFNYALEKIGEGPRPIEQIKKFFGAGADRIFYGILGDQDKALAAFEHYVDHQSELARGMRLHDGIRQLLDTLEAHKIPLGIVTGRHARDLEVVLRPHELAKHFKALVADSHLPKSKPAPDGILLAAQQMGLEARNTLYVGDSVMDLQAARAAGSVPVAALWDSLVKPDEMLRENPALMARTPQEIWPFFLNHFGTN